MLGLVSIVIIEFLCLGLGILVYLKNPKNKINQIFVVFVTFLVTWLITNYLENEPISSELAFLFLRIDFASGIVTAYFFFLFTLSFQVVYLISSRFKQVLFFLPAFSLSILSFSNLVINQMGFKDHIIYFGKGALYPLYALVLIGYIVGGCWSLVLKYKRLQGIEKVQTLYVLLGLSISSIIALITNLFLQQLIPVSIFRIGNYGFFFLVAFTAYAILRHHLLEVKVILTEILVGAVAILFLIQFLLSNSVFEYAWKGILLIIFAIFGYLLIKSVINEIKRREELQRLYEEVDKLSKTKSEFLSIASHQLRTPLTAIKGYISMLMEGTYGQLSEKQERPLGNVFQSNERLIKLVNDLLNLSRLEAGKIEFQPESVDLENMISNVVGELEINAKKKGLYIKILKPAAPLLKIMADPDKLRQVILNIIDNGIKYTRKGGITVEVQNPKSKIQIIVSDTGEGMTKEEMGNLFQMFSRTTAGSRLHTEGAGIGLYVAAKFIEMHGGKILAESLGKGRGSIFSIELPIK